MSTAPVGSPEASSEHERAFELRRRAVCYQDQGDVLMMSAEWLVEKNPESRAMVCYKLAAECMDQADRIDGARASQSPLARIIGSLRADATAAASHLAVLESEVDAVRRSNAEREDGSSDGGVVGGTGP